MLLCVRDMQEVRTDVISSADLYHYINNLIISTIYNSYKIGWVGESVWGVCVEEWVSLEW